MGITERIQKRAEEIYGQRYGKRRDISAVEIERVRHDAAIEVQKEIKQEGANK
jgi:hypothetical protein